MKTSFKILYYLDSNFLSLLEIKRTDLETETDKSKLYHWLILDKRTNQIQKLDFVSMNTSGREEERIFKQEKLQFNFNEGIYEGKSQTAELKVLLTDTLPKPVINTIEKYLLNF